MDLMRRALRTPVTPNRVSQHPPVHEFSPKREKAWRNGWRRRESTQISVAVADAVILAHVRTTGWSPQNRGNRGQREAAPPDFIGVVSYTSVVAGSGTKMS